MSSQLDEVGQGSHACWVVGPATPFEVWAADFLAAGADCREKPFWFVPEGSSAGSPAPAAVTRLEPGRSVLDGGPLDAAAMFAMFRRETDAARRAGFTGLRVVADMDWLRDRVTRRRDITTYELLLDEVVAELDATVICAYRTARFSDAEIAEVATVHPVTVGQPPADPQFRIWRMGAGIGWGLAGEVDLANAELFGQMLATAADRGSPLRLHAAGLWFVAVAGINAVLELVRSRPELRVVFAEAGPVLRRSWTLLELHRQVPSVELFPPIEDFADNRPDATTPEVAP